MKVSHKSAGVIALVLLLGLSVGCLRSPEVRKKKFYESGMQYFEQNRYREASIQFLSALQIDPKYGDAHYHLGLAYVQLRQWGEAYRAFLRAVELAPDFRPARLELAQVLLLANDLAEARARIGEVLARNPRDIRAQTLLARSFLVDKDFPRAIEELEKALQLAPDDAPLWSALGFARLGAKQNAQAEQDFRRAIRLDPTLVEGYGNLANLLRLARRHREAERLLRDAIERNPNSLEIHLLLADVYFQAGQIVELDALFAGMKARTNAFTDLQAELGDFWLFRDRVPRAIQEYEAMVGGSGNPLLQKKLINAYLSSARHADAERLTGELLRQNPRDTEARGFRGALACLRGNYAAAVEELQQVVKEQPDSLFAHFYLGLAWMGANKPELARGSFLECFRLQEKFPHAALKLSEIALLQGDAKGAAEYAQNALRLSAALVDGYVLLAQAWMQTGNLTGAERALQEAGKRGAPSATLHELTARLAVHKRDDATAVAEYEKALAASPKPLAILTSYTTFLMQRGRATTAVDRVRQWIDSHPPDPAYYELLARLELERKEFGAAQNAVRQAVQVDPNRWAPHFLSGQILEATGDSAGAIAAYDRAAERNAGFLPIYLRASELTLRRGQLDKAKQYITAAQRLDPAAIEVNHLLAQLYAERGENLDVALGMAQEVKRRRPNDPLVSDTLGWLYYKKGFHRAALEQLEPAARALPGEPLVLFHLGMTYSAAGQMDKARQVLERAVREGLTPPHLQLAQDTIQSLDSQPSKK